MSAADELDELIDEVDGYFQGYVEGRTRMLNAEQCTHIRNLLNRMREIVAGSRQ